MSEIGMLQQQSALIPLRNDGWPLGRRRGFPDCRVISTLIVLVWSADSVSPGLTISTGRDFQPIMGWKDLWQLQALLGRQIPAMPQQEVA